MVLLGEGVNSNGGTGLHPTEGPGRNSLDIVPAKTKNGGRWPSHVSREKAGSFPMEEREKRQTTRFPVPVYIEAFTESFPVGILRNVSPEGMFIQSTEPKAVGTRMDLSLRLPGAETKIQLTAEVVWVIYPPSFSETDLNVQPGKPVADNPGMGLRILSASPQDLVSLEGFVQESEVAGSDGAR
jgi:hypothetical protein